jgi:hypothetical protein
VIRAHKAAILARLRADTPMASNVIDGIIDPLAPVVPPPYVAVSMDSGRRTVERESSEQPTSAEFRIAVHSVGVDADQAGYFAEHVMAQLLGWRPTVTGWAPQAVQHFRSAPVQPDTTVNPATQYITDVFTLTSRRAA